MNCRTACPHAMKMSRSTTSVGNLFLKELEEVLSAHKVKCLHKIYEGDKQGRLLFLGLPMQLSQCEKHINGRPLCSEATLQLKVAETLD